jgi:hypothetical protein
MNNETIWLVCRWKDAAATHQVMGDASHEHKRGVKPDWIGK